MAQPIARIFETEQQARDAAAKLGEAGFSEDMIFLMTPGGEAMPARPHYRRPSRSCSLRSPPPCPWCAA